MPIYFIISILILVFQSPRRRSSTLGADQNLMSKSTNRLHDAIKENSVENSSGVKRVSLSAGTSTRLSLREKNCSPKKVGSEEWHANVLQTARILHDQIGHIAQLMNTVDNSDIESIDENEDSGRFQSTSGLLSPDVRKSCIDGLKEILAKVLCFNSNEECISVLTVLIYQIEYLKSSIRTVSDVAFKRITESAGHRNRYKTIVVCWLHE